MKLKAFKPLDHDISDPVFAAGLSLSKQSHASNLKKNYSRCNIMTFFRLCWFASLGLSAGRSGKSDFLQDKWANRTRCIQMLLSSVGPGTQHSQKEGKQAKDASAPLKIMILFNNMSRGYTAAPWLHIVFFGSLVTMATPTQAANETAHIWDCRPSSLPLLMLLLPCAGAAGAAFT